MIRQLAALRSHRLKPSYAHLSYDYITLLAICPTYHQFGVLRVIPIWRYISYLKLVVSLGILPLK